MCYVWTVSLISVYIALNDSVISELKRSYEEVLWPNHCNIQEFAWRVISNLKFAAVSVIDKYRVIGGIIHSFFNLAFPEYEWSISRSGLFYSSASNRILLRKRLSGPGNFLKREMSRVPANIRTPNRPAHSLVTLHQRFPTFLTRGALFRINFYGGAP